MKENREAGPAACVYISATMNKTAAARSPGSLQMKYRFKRQEKKKQALFCLDTTTCHRISGSCSALTCSVKLEKTCNLPALHLLNLTQIPIPPSASRGLVLSNPPAGPPTCSTFQFMRGRELKVGHETFVTLRLFWGRSLSFGYSAEKYGSKNGRRAAKL